MTTVFIGRYSRSETVSNEAKLRVTLIGDAGYNVFTRYPVTTLSESGILEHRPARDLFVPAGALLTQLALRELVPGCEATLLVPKSFGTKDSPTATQTGQTGQTFTRTLAVLERFPPRTDATKAALRIKRMTSLTFLSDRFGLDIEGRFKQYNLKRDGGADHPRWDHRERFINYGTGKPWVLGSQDNDTNVVVISDFGKFSAAAWDKTGDADPAQGMGAWLQKICAGKGGSPRIIVDIGAVLPKLGRDGKPTQALWKLLASDPIRHSVCVVVPVSMLREAGARISRRLSWEQSINDIAECCESFPTLAFLASFPNLIIRFGVAAALHRHRDVTSDKVKSQFAVLSKARDGIFRDQPDDGDVIAKNLFFVASLINRIAHSRDGRISADEVGESLREALYCLANGFDAGYSQADFDKARSIEFAASLFRSGLPPKLPLDHNMGRHAKSKINGALAAVLGRAPTAGAAVRLAKNLADAGISLEGPSGKPGMHYPACAVRSEYVVGVVPVPSARPEKTWCLFDRSVDQSVVAGSSAQRQAAVARAIVLYGPEFVLNRELSDPDDEYKELCAGQPEASWPKSITLVAPELRIGKLTVLLRDEWESFRSARNIIKSYVEREVGPTPTYKPVSVAVFGPPGSGKNFVITQLVDSINKATSGTRKALSEIHCNVSQFSTVDDLASVYKRVASVNNEGHIPLVVFDEFDCMGPGELGWLRYFLAPMQDGEFYEASQTIHIGKAVFVFSGGVYHSFSDFKAAGGRLPSKKSDRPKKAVSDKKDKASDPDAKALKNAKLPDFVSRLRGHINLQPVDADRIGTVPTIRRAMIIRGLLKKMGLIDDAGGAARALCDRELLNALLTVPKFEHGVRSIEAILHMCQPIGNKIEKASLPSDRQLEMHVNPAEFRRHIGQVTKSPRSEIGGVRKPTPRAQSSASHAKR